MEIPTQVQSLIIQGALFVVNHSAGKDSQAMLIELRKIVPAQQLLLVHADLGEVEWDGNIEHITATAPDLPLLICKSQRTFLQMVEQRGMWPSPQQRQCTSDLKRGPIDREVRRFLKVNPQFSGMVVNCMGLRAQESSSRAKAEVFKINTRNSIAGRQWFDWLPIHKMSTDEVFATIADAGQKPHPVYAKGMSRLSCRFCIMASVHDLRTAAQLSPVLYSKYVSLEKRIGHTMNTAGKSLEDVTGIQAIN